MDNLYAAYLSRPVIRGSKFDAIMDVADDTAKTFDIKNGVVSFDSGFNEGVIQLTLTMDAEEKDGKYKMIQEFPTEFIQNLLAKKDEDNKNIFCQATYSGYTVEKNEPEEGKDPKSVKDQVSFNITVNVSSNQSAYDPEADTAEQQVQE